jgi:F0F1-type ATP synthase assembly protein I
MAIILVAGVYAGIKLDEYAAFKIPVFTLVFTIVSAGLAIYSIIKEFV